LIMPLQTHNETSGFESPDPFLFAYAKGYVEQVSSGNGAFMLERYLHHQRWVLKKSLSPGYAQNSLLQQALRREFEYGFRFSHPGLPQYFHFEDQDPSNLFLVREWVDGQTLKEWAASPRTWKDKLAVLIQLADALCYLHSHQVIHRDLSPKNVLVCHGKLLVKLIDTGFAAHETELVMGGGTPGFAAPEQLQGATPTPQQDVYAFGKLMAILFPPGSSCPKAIHTLVKTCTHSDSGSRPATMDEVAKTLARVAERRHFTFGIIALLLLSASVWMLFPAKKTQLPAPSKLPHFQNGSAEKRVTENNAIPTVQPTALFSIPKEWKENFLLVPKEDSLFADSLLMAYVCTMEASLDSTKDLPKAKRLRILLPRYNEVCEATLLKFDAWILKQKAKGRHAFASEGSFRSRYAKQSQAIREAILR